MIIVVGTHKGGSGKSTVAVNLAVGAALQDERVMLIDADPIGTASRWVEDREASEHSPAVHGVAKHGNLKATLRAFDADYDHVIVDVAGRDSQELRTAMVLADLLIIPVQPSQADLDVLEGLAEVVEAARDLNEDLDARIVLNRAPTHARSTAVADARAYVQSADIPFPVLDAVLHERQVYRDVFATGTGVLETNNAQARAEMRALTREVFA